MVLGYVHLSVFRAPCDGLSMDHVTIDRSVGVERQYCSATQVGCNNILDISTPDQL